MALEPGTSFGPYEIAGQIGSGGMGEVYRATDTNLKRDVAIKILPPAFAEDADRIARFQREAEALAALNHSNIAQIYGLERGGEGTALAMELVEGPTLADRIAEGPLPVDEALAIAHQIADALEAAHGRQIVHRDLKPANIKLRPDGTVKVLDFGIATAPESVVATSGRRSPTLLTPALTEAGVLLGTAAYMSPEQARGRAVDQRADIWAFGCVLYEMLTGQLAFAGEDVTTTLARVLEREANTAVLPTTLPSPVRHTIALCLEKDPGKRIADIRDVKLALAGRFDSVAPTGAPEAVSAEPAWRRAAVPSIAAILAIALTGLVAWMQWPAPDREVTRFSVDLAGALAPDDPIALSPDGRRIVYAANGQLYSQRLDQDAATAIPGTEQAVSPFFAPDGESVAFFTPTQLKTVGFAGQLPRVIATVDNAPGLVGNWDREGRIIFGQNGPFGLSTVPAVGGDPELFADLSDYNDLDYPDTLPGGAWVLYTANRIGSDWSGSDIVAQNVATGERKIVLERGHFARYLPTGHLVFVRDATLYAAAFDAKRLAVVGPVVPVVQGVASNNGSGVAKFAVASNGTLIYTSGNALDTRESMLVQVDREGNASPLSMELRDYHNPRISPDGTRVAVEVAGADERVHIWIMDLASGSATQLTFEGVTNKYPVWTLDSKDIIYTSKRDDTFSLYRKAADGTGEATRIFDGTQQLVATDVLPDNRLVYQDASDNARRDIFTIGLDDDGPATPLLASPADELSARVSPDGVWIAYLSSDESSQNRVYIRPYASPEGGQRVVSQELSAGPVWSLGGAEIAFIGGPPNGLLMSASIRATATTINPGRPQELFGFFAAFDAGDFLSTAPYDVLPSGDGFVAIQPAALARGDDAESVPARPTINVVLNWFEELRRLVPAR